MRINLYAIKRVDEEEEEDSEDEGIPNTPTTSEKFWKSHGRCG